MSNNGTSKWKEDDVLTNNLVYFKKCKFTESEKDFKFLVEFGKDFQRKEENESKDFPLIESQKLWFGVFLA